MLAVAPVTKAGATMVTVPEWIERHCVIPDGADAGEPFRLTDWQLRFVAEHYSVRAEAQPGLLAPAFVYRRSQLVMPQKAGKAPLTAAMVCLEGVGPALFAGWATGGETYRCAEHGCRCGWRYAYSPGEPMGRPWPTPLIQLTATSEEQCENVYDALRPMIDNGPLADMIPKTGEEFIRLPRRGRIDTVTSNARSRLGQRVTFVIQDETGLWTKTTGMLAVAKTQRRGLAGMGGRAVETTNAYDPTEDSVAQRTAESKATDLYRMHPLAPPGLRYDRADDRRRIHAHVYCGSPWVDLDAIEAEAAELIERDPAEAERFFGNRVVAGGGHAFSAERWAELAGPDLIVPDRALIVVGVDGARYDDALAIVATAVETGHQWPLCIIETPADAGDDYEHDFEEADRAMLAAFDRYDVWRVNCDPQWIGPLVDRWVGRWGDKKIVEWLTHRDRPIGYAVRAYLDALKSGDLSHSGDGVLGQHIANSVRRPIRLHDDAGRGMFTLTKPRDLRRKIDGAMAAVLSWEARGCAIAADARPSRGRGVTVIL